MPFVRSVTTPTLKTGADDITIFKTQSITDPGYNGGIDLINLPTANNYSAGFHFSSPGTFNKTTAALLTLVTEFPCGCTTSTIIFYVQINGHLEIFTTTNTANAATSQLFILNPNDIRLGANTINIGITMTGTSGLFLHEVKTTIEFTFLS